VTDSSASARLVRERDRLEAFRTIPRQVRHRRAALGAPAVLPAVDDRIWLLHVRLARHRDKAARAELVAEYEPMAKAIARRFHRQREPLEDLEQVAMEALLLALDRFEPDRSTPFPGFANPTIIGSLKRYYRDSGWALRVPRRVHELSRPIRDTAELLTQDLGRAPNVREIADLLGVEPDDVSEALVAGTARAVTSLDGTSSASSDAPTADRVLGEADVGLGRVEDLATLRSLVEPLDPDDRLLLHRYFVEDLTQSRIAELLGVSQMQVSRTLTRLLRRLRSHLPGGG
jgi:RNA polymerase sigma-B factor